MSSHNLEIAKAVLVTILWSSSFIIVKNGLEEISPLIFASLRYLTASVILLGLLLYNNRSSGDLKKVKRSDLLLLLVYGLLFISLTQGLQFVALDILPTITISFVLNFSAFIVIIISVFTLRESPTRVQLLFFGLALIAAILYFYPLESFPITITGIAVLGGVLLANSVSQVLGRYINHRLPLGALTITSLSMTMGSSFLFIFALSVESLPVFSIKIIVMILWLAVVNTAFAFTLWNSTMVYLKAYESSIINNTMLPQITLLAVIFLGEQPSLTQWVSLGIMVISAIGVSLFKKKEEQPPISE